MKYAVRQKGGAREGMYEGQVAFKSTVVYADTADQARSVGAAMLNLRPNEVEVFSETPEWYDG